MKSLVRSNGTLFPAIPSLFDDFFTRDFFNGASGLKSGGVLPAVNIVETNDDFKIEVAAPGLKREDFKVELDNSMLTISSQHEEQKENKNTDENYYTRREFSYHSFERSFTLPEDKVDAGAIAARYEDGILYITIPKNENAKVKPAKQIAVA
jgi:HSP20 family protein